MKQTKKFLSIMRTVSGMVAILLIVLYTLIIGFNLTAVYTALVALWPYGAAVLVAYTVFSLGEEFVNNRILRPQC